MDTGKLPRLQSLDTSILPLFFEETPLLYYFGLIFKYPAYQKKYSNDDDDDDDPLF